MYDFQAIVIGGGPSAMSSVLYLSRLGIETGWIRGEAGGKLNDIPKVANVLGFGELSGEKLSNTFTQSVAKLPFIVKYDTNVSKVIKNNHTFVVRTEDDLELTCRKVIVASGSHPRELPIKELPGLVSYCALCDAPDFRGKHALAVVGGGQNALEQALLLTNYVDNVYLIHWRDTFRGLPGMSEKVIRHPKIHLILDSELTQVEEEEGRVVAQIKHKSGRSTLYLFDGVFIAVGMEPNTSFLTETARNEKGFIVVDNNLESVNVKGIYAAGDVMARNIQQISVAIGDGAKAAINLANSLY